MDEGVRPRDWDLRETGEGGAVISLTRLEDERLGLLRRRSRHPLPQLLPDEADGGLDEVLDNILHVPAHVTQLRVFGGLDLGRKRSC